jgi:pimeloyl-ACP methyl ester carboxylesterase
MRTALAAALALLLLIAGGCDDDSSETPVGGAFTPTLEEATCPTEVDNVLFSGYSCQLLSVADGIEVLVTRIDPGSGPALDNPLVLVGEEYGTTLNYAGLAAVPDRVGRTTYFVNARGVAGSRPDLACPEVDALTDELLAAGGDESGRTTWLAAVQQCHDRLEASGLDLAGYGSDSMAGDVLALVDALGVDSWAMGTWGGASIIAMRVLAQDPPGLDAVFMDSPQLPGDDPRVTLADDTRRALGDLLAECAADAACTKLPHSLAELDAAAAALDQAPLRRTVKHREGEVTVTVDGTMLIRLLRHSLAIHGAGSAALTMGAVPAIIEASAHWTAAMDTALLGGLTTSAPYCEGYLPTCPSFHRTTLGVLLTELCRNHGPQAGAEVGDDAIEWYATASPYLHACAT